MKILVSFLVLIQTHLIFGQIQTIKPNYLFEFDLHPDSIAQFNARHHLIDSLFQIPNPNDSIRNILDNADIMELENDDPFYIGPIGCSWYCAGSPDTIYSIFQTDTSYSPDKIHDMDLKSAWRGDSVNNTVFFDFKLSESLNVTKVIIYSGKCSSLQDWNENTRPRIVKLTVNDSIPLNLKLNNGYDGQVFELRNHLPKNQKELKLEFKVTEVFLGTEENKSFFISEINFDGVGDH